MRLGKFHDRDPLRPGVATTGGCQAKRFVLGQRTAFALSERENSPKLPNCSNGWQQPDTVVPW